LTLLEAINQHLAKDENGLRRCAHCGGKTEQREITPAYADCSSWMPQCTVCGAIHNAVSKHNTRSSDPLLIEALRRLEAVQAYLENFGFKFQEPSPATIDKELYYEHQMVKAEKEAQKALAAIRADYHKDASPAPFEVDEQSTTILESKEG
jgi:hypothetical protein